MEIKDAVESLSALAHDGRLALFRRLMRAGPAGMAAGDLARAAGLNPTTASAQLSVLAQAGLIGSRREGRSIFYAVENEAMRALLTFLVEECCEGRAEICAPLVETAQRAMCCD